MYIAAQAIQLGHDYWTLAPTRICQSGRELRPMLGPETFVVPLQNGVEAPAQLVSVLGAERVLGGMCRTLSFLTAPGRIKSVGQVHTVDFGEPIYATPALVDGRVYLRTAGALYCFGN